MPAANGRTKTRKPPANGRTKTAPRKPKPLATLAPEHLVGLRARYEAAESQASLAQIVRESYTSFARELAVAYELPPQYEVNWTTGEVTPARG